MTSSTGVITACNRLDRDIKIPKGIPRPIHKKVATEIMATVAIVSSHMPNQPIAKNETIVPIAMGILRAPSHAREANIKIISGQGASINRFSNHTIKNISGSKKPSIASPFAREKSRKAKSMPFFISLRPARPKEGNSSNNSTVFPMY